MSKKQSKSLSEQLRQTIDDSGLTRYRIAKESGIDEPKLSRFYHGQAGLSQDNLDRLAECLEIKIVARGKRQNRKVRPMASLSTLKSGARLIQFEDGDGNRRTIRLGKIAKRSAIKFKMHVEELVSAKLARHAPDDETSRWLAKIGDKLHQKLADVDLVPRRNSTGRIMLSEHLEHYFEKRTDVKENTLVHWRQSKRSLLTYFGADKPLAEITPGDARDFERWLKTGKARKHRYGETEASEGLAVNTLRKRISDAKQFFEDAVDRELIPKNPFQKLSGTVGSNRERDYFISRADAAKIIDTCPDAEWRLIFALARYAGLRIPSELLALAWDDINWAETKMLIHASKTEHHEGKGSRWVPIFPELKPFLAVCWESAAPGTVYVISRYRERNQNLRTQLGRIIRRAGVKPWPKLFQNLRASRATELAAEHPAHVAAAWLGHSTLVANKHYWQVTEDDFKRATGSGQRTADSALQNAPAETVRKCGK